MTRDPIEGRTLDARPQGDGARSSFPPPGPDAPADATRWSQIQRLGERGDTPEQQASWAEAWNYLFTTFRPALENQVRRVLRRNGWRPEECEDVVQDFWAKCLEKDWLTRADRRIGRFRTFAYVCVRRHCQRVLERRRAACRTPPTPVQRLDAAPEPAREDVGGAFGADWLACLLDQGIARLGARTPSRARVLRARLQHPEDDLATLALRLGSSAQATAVALHRARRDLRRIVAEIAGDGVGAGQHDASLMRALERRLRWPETQAARGGAGRRT